MKRVTQAVSFLMLGLIMAVGFQNCGGYVSADNPLYDQASEAVCVGLACGMDTSFIKLSIANDAVTLKKVSPMPTTCTDNDSHCVDVAGYCDTGGFATTKVYATLYEGSTIVSSELDTYSKCIDGRYSFQYILPSNYNFDMGHTLQVKLVAFDGTTSNIYSNSTGANVRYLVLTSY